ncbi:hypothetical protein F4680DRAFT_448703 [Xylaria scruposa]|nr:hypothetical protein F4680DRAFT_448703 [Xylaria scruposa]
MSSILGDRYAMGNCFLLVTFLTLLALADNILANALPLALDPEPPQVPGFWNLTTTALVLSTISDLIGQMSLIPVAYFFSSQCAMKLNSLSILIASVFSLASLFWRADGLSWIPAIAGILKTIGGGSHATIFLTVSLIRKNSFDSLRATLIYTTGAAVVLCQTIASTVTPFLARQNQIMPYIFSITCCILASTVTTIYDAAESSASVRACADDPSTQPLLLHETASQDPQSATLWELGEIHYRTWNNTSSLIREALKSLGWIFFLAAVAKATRPLFLTYIQHRVGITPELASHLWSVRTVMSLVIFVVFLPLVVVVLVEYTPWPPNAINLYTAKISVILLTTGALLIGLARSKPVLVSGLVINTLGVATDLALLSFAADIVTDDLANCLFMTIASLESAGTLIGILLLYPLYQLGLRDKTLFGGIPYYLCAGLFTIAGIKVWQMKPLSVR